MKMQARQFLLCGVCGAAVFLAACSGGKSSASTVAAPPASPAPAASQPSTAAPPGASAATAGDIAEYFSVSGPLVVEHQVDVSAQRDGVIASLSADVNTRVRSGDELARLDDRQLAATLEAARAKTRSIDNDLKNWEAETKMLESDYVRAQKLHEEHIWSEEQLQHARYAAEADEWETKRAQELLAAAKSDERNLELELEKARIAAPFDGIVARRYVRAGQSVAKGDRLFWVTAEGPLRVRFTLPEKFIRHIHERDELQLISPDAPLERHTARVTEISPVVDPASGTIEVVAELQGAKGSLRPGMAATIRIPNPR